MKKKKKSCLKRAILLLPVLLLLFTAFQFVYPDVSELKTKNPEKTAFMSYREKEWESEGKKYRITQKWVPLRAISPYLVKAVLIR